MTVRSRRKMNRLIVHKLTFQILNSDLVIGREAGEKYLKLNFNYNDLHTYCIHIYV